MGEVLPITKKTAEAILEHLDELREKVASGEVEALFITSWNSNYDDIETLLLGVIELDLIEQIGILELMKHRAMTELG